MQLPTDISERVDALANDDDDSIKTEISLLKVLIERAVADGKDPITTLKVVEKALLGVMRMLNADRKFKLESGELISRNTLIGYTKDLIRVIIDALRNHVDEETQHQIIDEIVSNLKLPAPPRGALPSPG